MYHSRNLPSVPLAMVKFVLFVRFSWCSLSRCFAHREVVQAAFVEVAELKWGQPGVDALRSKLRSRQGDLQLSMAAADAVVKETIR